MDKRKRLLAIINPMSGTGNKEAIPELIDSIISVDKWNISLCFTEHPAHATQLARQAVDEQVDVVVAVGGDGTLNEVATALVNTPVALGIVPCGSGNGFARHLHISLNVREALETINNGYSERVDYCTVNGRPFFCTCGAGFDAQVSHKFAEAGSRGMVTYIKTTINEFFKYHGEHFKIIIDDTVIQEKAFVVACCNAAQYGNNAFIAPQASMQDGLIDVTVIHNFNLINGALLGARMLTRLIEHDKHVSIYRGHHVVIERDNDDIIHIDGDPLMMPHNLDIRCVNQGLTVLLNKQVSNKL